MEFINQYALLFLFFLLYNESSTPGSITILLSFALFFNNVLYIVILY